MNLYRLTKNIAYDKKNGTSHSVDFLLSNKVRKTLSIPGIKIRKIISPKLIKEYESRSDYKLTIDSRAEIPKRKRGTIFVVNHRQADDIVLAAQVINQNGYVVFGNADLALETQDGLGLWANGVIIVDRDNELSKKAAYKKMKYILKHGGNIIIYPEGYWNLDDNGLADAVITDDGHVEEKHGADDHNSESWLLQDFHIGAIRLAKEIGSTIVPVTLHYDEIEGKNCYGTRGEPFKVGKTDDVFEKKDELKEIMQSTYYGLMEKHSSYKREELEANGKTLKQQWGELKEELIAACDIKKINYHLDLKNEKLIGKAKVINPVVTNEEAFAHLDDIDYNKNSAFLVSKDITGRRK